MELTGAAGRRTGGLSLRWLPYRVSSPTAPARGRLEKPPAAGRPGAPPDKLGRGKGRRPRQHDRT